MPLKDVILTHSLFRMEFREVVERPSVFKRVLLSCPMYTPLIVTSQDPKSAFALEHELLARNISAV